MYLLLTITLGSVVIKILIIVLFQLTIIYTSILQCELVTLSCVMAYKHMSAVIKHLPRTSYKEMKLANAAQEHDSVE